jgi:TonB family protein
LLGPEQAALAPAPPRPVDRRVEAKLVSAPAPTYPPQARAVRVEGDVVIEALIDAGGNVRPVKVISGHPLLQQSAMNAVRNWKYQPARLNDQPIATQTQIRVSFRL